MYGLLDEYNESESYYKLTSKVECSKSYQSKSNYFGRFDMCSCLDSHEKVISGQEHTSHKLSCTIGKCDKGGSACMQTYVDHKSHVRHFFHGRSPPQSNQFGKWLILQLIHAVHNVLNFFGIRNLSLAISINPFHPAARVINPSLRKQSEATQPESIHEHHSPTSMNLKPMHANFRNPWQMSGMAPIQLDLKWMSIRPRAHLIPLTTASPMALVPAAHQKKDSTIFL